MPTWKQSVREIFMKAARAVAIPYYQQKLARFEKLLNEAHAVQRKRLFEKLRRCADTRFGRVHGFAGIKTLADFRRQLPIAEYDYFEPYIDDAASGRLDALLPRGRKGADVRHDDRDHRCPKLNPVTATWLHEYRRGWEIWGIKALVEHPRTIGAKLLQVVGPATSNTCN